MNINGFYNAAIMHYLDLLPNSGALNIDNQSVFMAECGSVDRGTKIKLYIKINNDIIERAKYLVYGDGYIIAALGLLSEELPGLKLNQAAQFSMGYLAEKLSIPQDKTNNLKIIKQAIDNIMKQYNNLKK